MFSFSIALWLAATSLVMTTELKRPLITTTVTTCDSTDNVQRLSCEQGVISVQTVLYGRLDRETCSEGWSAHLSNINCVQSGSKGVLQARCDGRSSCEVNVNLFRFSDPCYGTYKYLQTTFACVVSETPHEHSSVRSVACEHSIAHLRCEEGKVIHISAANYGRLDNLVCSFGRPSSQLQTTHCTSHATLDKVGKMCNGKSVCSVKATHTAFGDPCYGIYKYLQVDHSCRSASV